MIHDELAVWSTMEAKPGKEGEVREFLIEAARRMGEEPGTSVFYSMEMGEGQFAIFCTFVNTAALEDHIAGPAAQWVLAQQSELFTKPFDIVQTHIITTKAVVNS